MDWYEPEVRALIESLKARPLPERPAVFYGSSSIRLWQDLSRDLGDSRALNLGFGGSTLAACAYFFERLVPPVNPASLVIYAGDNDLGDGSKPEQVLAEFRALAKLVKSSLPGVPCGYISIKLSPVRVALREFCVKANELIRRAIDDYPQMYFIDVYDAMLDDKGQPLKELYLEDGLHLSRAGYRLWTELLEPYRNRIFIPLPPKSDVTGLDWVASTH